METLVSTQLRAEAPATMCVGLEMTVIEDLIIIKDGSEELFVYLCVIVYLFSIESYFLPVWPTYSALGRIRRLSAYCSRI